VSVWVGLADAPQGSLQGKTVVDCTNAVDYATFELKPSSGSAAEQVAELAPGAHVVKALHLFAGRSWLTPASPDAAPRTLAICGDHRPALESTAELVRALGGVPATIGPLKAARQLEDAAGLVMRLVAAGVGPITAVPHVPAGVGPITAVPHVPARRAS
jgi:8-hydroxy-5-deazaflavin:NADPH oxidoreductase